MDRVLLGIGRQIQDIVSCEVDSVVNGSTMLYWTPHLVNLVIGRHLHDVVSWQARAWHALERVLLGGGSHMHTILDWEVVGVVGGDVTLCIWMSLLRTFVRDYDAGCRVVCVFCRL